MNTVWSLMQLAKLNYNLLTIHPVADPEDDPGVQKNPHFTRSLHANLTHKHICKVPPYQLIG